MAVWLPCSSWPIPVSARGAAEDAELLKGEAERTWAALQRAQTEKAAREREERQLFLLASGDAIRTERNASGKIEAAARLLGEKLGARRVLSSWCRR